MRTSSRIAQFVIVTLASTVTFAGDVESTSPGPDPSRQITKPASLSVPSYPAQWLPDASVYSSAERESYAATFVALDFRDDSALARLGRIRNLSLLTLSETKRTRVFLGVNGDGLVGLHFVAIADNGADRYLSLARLPYLKKKTPRK